MFLGCILFAMKSIRVIRVFFITFLLFFLCLSFLPLLGATGELKVSFLNVGQGDSIYISSPTGREVLIDGGKDAQVLGQVRSVKQFWDTTFDLVVATHSDLDHIGGLFPVLRRYSADTIILSHGKSDTSFDESLLREAQTQEKENSSRILFAEEGMEFDLGGGARLMILAPAASQEKGDTNERSTVMLLTYKDKTFLFMADVPLSVEREIIQKYSLKNITVLKAGHHGSKTSTGDVFLSEVRPEYVVISVGANNSYGHPHEEVLNRLTNFKTTTLRTDQEGRIEFTVSPEGRLLLSFSQ
jgi:beta-lactamase superfamily II metal-dependent hydrolase